MKRWSGNLSRWLNRMLGGEAGASLCASIADRYGVQCWFCRGIAILLRESDHCAAELETLKALRSRRDS